MNAVEANAAQVVIAPLSPPRAGTDAATNEGICRAMGLELLEPGRRPGSSPDVVVDAIFGTGLDRAVGGAAAGWIEWINGQDQPVLAVDVPSGLDCDTGAPLGYAVRADRTVTFVGLKRGFLEPAAQPYIGEVVVVDIGAPIELYERLGTPAPR